jgi:integrase
MTSWRTAWRKLRKAAGLEKLRTHDGRHTAITTMDEKGVPANVIEAQVGQSKLLKDYLHHRRRSLNAAAAALEPAFMTSPEDKH